MLIFMSNTIKKSQNKKSKASSCIIIVHGGHHPLQARIVPESRQWEHYSLIWRVCLYRYRTVEHLLMSLRRRHLRRRQESVVCTFKSQCPLKSEIGYFCTHVHNFINLLAICRSRMSNKRNQYSSKRGYKKRHNSHSCRDIFSSIWSSDNGYVNLFFFVSPGSEDGLWYAIFFIILVISVIYYVTSMKQLRDAGQWC